MSKLIVVSSVIVVIGVGLGAYTFWRVGNQLDQIQTGASTPSAVNSDSPPASLPRVTPTSLDPETATLRSPDQAQAEASLLTPDELSPFGHETQHSLSFEDQDASATPGTLASDTDSDAASEAALLEEARATLQALLGDPDPDVRSEAAALLQVLDSGPR